MSSKSKGSDSSNYTERIFYLILVFVTFQWVSAEGNKIYDMQALCEDRFRQALYRKIEGAYLKSQNERNLDCIVTFQTHSILQRFMLRFDLLQLDCNDHLFIYDGAHAVDSYKEGIADEKVSSKSPKLTTAIKGLLRIPVDRRTEEEKDTLSKVMGSGRIQCFERYPENVREGLSTSAMFAYFPPGRVLVAEGHPSVAMYFILSGQANVSKIVYDPGVKKLRSVDVAVMSDGDAFGEINILHDEPWPTTVTTLTHVEILTILKEQFQNILEEFLGEQQREITKCLNKFAYFKDWNHQTVVECCILARVTKVADNILIVGDNYGNAENAYFIVSGSCQVVYHLRLEHVPRQNYVELKVLQSNSKKEHEVFPLSNTLKNVEGPRRRKIADPFVTGLIVDKTLQQIINELPLVDSPSETGKQMQVQSYFFQIAKLESGACFGIGESLENKFILSSSHPTVLLAIPKFFLKLHNLGNMWGRIREFFNHAYPSPQKIFSQFLVDRKWIKSRRKYLETLIKPERPFTGLTKAEAPYYSRLMMDVENPIFRWADLSCRNTKTSVGVIFTRTNFVTLKYVTDNWGTENNGFRLVITAVKDPKHECKDFRCHQKEFCVHPELLCDGISHCADGSDESSAKCSKNDAGYVLGVSLPIFVVVSVSFLLILSALGVVAGLAFCRNRPSAQQQGTPSHSQHPLHQVYSGSNGTSQIHVQKSTLVPGTTVITPLTVNWVHPVVLGYLVVWARLYCQAE